MIINENLGINQNCTIIYTGTRLPLQARKSCSNKCKTIFVEEPMQIWNLLQKTCLSLEHYVMKKVDKLAKTHREIDKENVSGHMAENSEIPEDS